MSYWQIKKVSAAKSYLDAREAQQKITQPNRRLEASRVWLEGYMARPRATRIDWAPRLLVVTPPKEIEDGQEIENA